MGREWWAAGSIGYVVPGFGLLNAVYWAEGRLGQARVCGAWRWGGLARRARCLARTMSGSRASSGSGSGDQRAGRCRLLIRICLTADPFRSVPGACQLTAPAARAVIGRRGPGREWTLRRAGSVRRDAAGVGKQRAGVLEQHGAVAEQAPSLLGVRYHDVGGGAIGCVRGRTGRLMLAHDALPWICRLRRLMAGSDR